MLALALALLLSAAGPDELALLESDAAAAAPAVSYPPGAPRDDYGLVAWCYGALSGYLELHDQVMPEVVRIESTYHRPGSVLADDLRVYADLQKTSRAHLKLFSRALQAAEQASRKPINTLGVEAMQRGRRTWAGAEAVSKARLAQEWMGWTLPGACETTAQTLETRAKLMGATFAPATEAPAP